jgi:hypothetical protein
VWDVATGLQADFFYEPPGCALGDADMLQWLSDTNTLMVATMFPRTDSSFLTLLDFRDKSVVWSWTDGGTPALLEEKRAVHAVVLEDGRTVCVVNQYEELGFLDLRKSAGGVRWSLGSKLMVSDGGKKKTKREETTETCYPKLAAHRGQLFASAVSVFSGPDHVLTSALRGGGNGGSICDFSISGDRLFVLHNETTCSTSGRRRRCRSSDCHRIITSLVVSVISGVKIITDTGYCSILIIGTKLILSVESEIWT